MITRSLYKHRNNTDVAIEIVKSFFVREKRLFKFHVQWWNIGKCHAPQPMLIKEKIEIPLELWRENWQPYFYRTPDDPQPL